ncbi:MAG: alpha/beta hydrolase [Lachnospiraceae bacterium]|nr:alpha/beta hydrolase [Lachnospiraceae bacterium]
MICKTVPVREGSDAVLELYILEKSCEWKTYEKRPFVIVCPGGGYAMCGDRDSEPVALEYVGARYHSAVLRYSIRPQESDPPVGDAPFRDLFAAIRLVRKHAEEWGADPDRIILEGDSAGAHAAAMAGVFWQDTGRFPEAGEEAKPNALVLGYPVISADADGHKFSIANLCGTVDYGEDVIDAYSAERHVGSHVPPTFLWHSVCDQTVSFVNSCIFAQELHKAGVPFELHLFATGWHGLGLGKAEVGGVEPNAAQWFPISLSWLKAMGLAPAD